MLVFSSFSLFVFYFYVLLLLATLTAKVYGIPAYRNKLPNPTTTEVCRMLGHEGCVAGAAANAFGADFKAANYEYSISFCQLDSDGDGVSNGAELGDPCCNYKEGDTENNEKIRTDDISDPSDKNSIPKNPENRNCGASRTTPTDGPTITPTPKLSTDEKKGSKRACFPAQAMLMLESGQVVTMENLKIGDRVQVGRNEFSAVFMFTHKLQYLAHEFLVLRADTTTLNEMTEVAVTAGHYLYVNGRLAAAKSAKVGDTIRSANDDVLIIKSITTETMRGLYNPQTVHGDIVVDGVKASTYTDTIVHDAAHALLAPFRALYSIYGYLGTIIESSV